MPFRLGRWLVVLAVVFATGSHWFFLQSVAWLGMTVEFSRTEPLSTALQKTFDGRHPCGLCKLVHQGQKAERKGEMQKSDTKLDLFCERTAILTTDPLAFSDPVAILLHLTARSEAPPVPPPRFV
jgi:hypothetical protein